VIRRKDEEGKLKSIDFNLHAIKGGKASDPLIQPGDAIEIKD